MSKMKNTRKMFVNSEDYFRYRVLVDSITYNLSDPNYEIYDKMFDELLRGFRASLVDNDDKIAERASFRSAGARLAVKTSKYGVKYLGYKWPRVKKDGTVLWI